MRVVSSSWLRGANEECCDQDEWFDIIHDPQAERTSRESLRPVARIRIVRVRFNAVRVVYGFKDQRIINPALSDPQHGMTGQPDRLSGEGITNGSGNVVSRESPNVTTA
jgi:hypothetical protein